MPDTSEPTAIMRRARAGAARRDRVDIPRLERGRSQCAVANRHGRGGAPDFISHQGPDDERSKRYEEMSAAVNKAREEEKAGERAWRAAMERAEKEIPQ
jgi:hypothetical protein